MTRSIRMAVVAVALVTVASACSNDKKPQASEAPTPSTSTPPTHDATVIDIKVAGGKVTTAQNTVKVKLGSKVRLVVTADVADEVHVHTYDKKQDLQPGVASTIEFTADIPGQIEVELEKRSQTLVTLNIQ